jgi:membrane-associated phospholipid phosphatase
MREAGDLCDAPPARDGSGMGHRASVTGTIAVLAAMWSGVAQAEPTAPTPGADPAPAPAATTFDGRSDATRWHHAETILAAGALYLGIEIFANKDLASTTCRWCTPPSFDASIYHHLVWNDASAASNLSTLTGYVVEPLFVMSTLVIAEGDERSFRRAFDDLAPIFESATFVGLLQHLAKYSVARERPFAYFDSQAIAPTSEHNLSFFSGHTALDFAVTTSAGIVAHKRHSRAEPLIWAGGYTLGVVTAYLRVSSGAHYFSDVAAGAVIGTGVGIAVPLLLHSDLWRAVEQQHSMVVVPGGPAGSPGVTLAGLF